LSIGAFGHTNNKHSIANLELLVMSKTKNWLEKCSLELFLIILLGFVVWKGLICLCLHAKNYFLFCLLSFIGMWYNLWRLWQRWCWFMKEQCFEIGLASCLIFLCLVVIGIGDGAKLVDNGNEKFFFVKLNTQFVS